MLCHQEVIIVHGHKISLIKIYLFNTFICHPICQILLLCVSNKHILIFKSTGRKPHCCSGEGT